MGFLHQDNNYFGLDIGTTAIRLVQLKGTGSSRPVLVTYGDIKVPPGVTTSDSSLDREKVANLVKQLVKSAKASTKEVIVGLPTAAIFASVITTPQLSHGELEKAIKYQSDQYIPMALDQVQLDWAVLGEGANEHEQEVLLVAAPKTVAQKYVDILQKADLEVVALEVNAVAETRALLPSSQNLSVMVLDVGGITSDITIVHDNSPRLLRSVPVGVTTLVKSVSQNLGIDEAQAEQFTFKFGLTQNKLEGQVLKVVKPTLDSLMTEIEKSIQFFNTRYPGSKLEKIILTGKAVDLPEFATYLANNSGLPVEKGNPWVNVAYPTGQQDSLMGLSSQYAVACGLAQRMFV